MSDRTKLRRAQRQAEEFRRKRLQVPAFSSVESRLQRVEYILSQLVQAQTEPSDGHTCAETQLNHTSAWYGSDWWDDPNGEVAVGSPPGLLHPGPLAISLNDAIFGEVHAQPRICSLSDALAGDTSLMERVLDHLTTSSATDDVMSWDGDNGPVDLMHFELPAAPVPWTRLPSVGTWLRQDPRFCPPQETERSAAAGATLSGVERRGLASIAARDWRSPVTQSFLFLGPGERAHAKICSSLWRLHYLDSFTVWDPMGFLDDHDQSVCKCLAWSFFVGILWPDILPADPCLRTLLELHYNFDDDGNFTRKHRN